MFNFRIIFFFLVFSEGLDEVGGRWGKKRVWILGFHVIQRKKSMDHFSAWHKIYLFLLLHGTHPKLPRRCMKGVQIMKRGQERHLKGWKLSDELITFISLCTVSAQTKKPRKERKYSSMLCFSYLASKTESNASQRKYINSGACSMGGSDPLQIHNFVTENHRSWNALHLGKNILSSSTEKRKTQRGRPKPHCTNICGWNHTRSGTNSSFIAKGEHTNVIFIGLLLGQHLLMHLHK